MTPETEALISLDLDEVLRQASARYAERPAEERERHTAGIAAARIEAARYLLARGNADDRKRAARFAFGMARSAA